MAEEFNIDLTINWACVLYLAVTGFFLNSLPNSCNEHTLSGLVYLIYCLHDFWSNICQENPISEREMMI